MSAPAVLAADAVRAVVRRYFALCDVPNREDPRIGLPSVFAEDAVWRGAGKDYGGEFGAHRGREAIVSFLLGYLPPNPHFRANRHDLAEVAVSVDGLSGSGVWRMAQSSVLADGSSDSRAAEITVEVALPEGADTPLITRFTTLRLDSPLPSRQGGQS